MHNSLPFDAPRWMALWFVGGERVFSSPLELLLLMRSIGICFAGCFHSSSTHFCFHSGLPLQEWCFHASLPGSSCCGNYRFSQVSWCINASVSLCFSRTAVCPYTAQRVQMLGAVNARNQTPLMIAVQTRDEELVRAVVEFIGDEVRAIWQCQGAPISPIRAHA